MTRTNLASSSADDAPVTIATFPNPYEAELAHAVLDSQGIPAIVHNDHGQYLSAGSWVHLQVAQGDSERATALLEDGPLYENAAADESGSTTDTAGPPDDMAPLRAKRRMILARWLLYAGAVMFLLYGLLLPLSVVALALALWSRRDPRRAFGAAWGLQTVVVFVSVAISGLAGLTSLIPLLAFYFAWASAAPVPEPSLVASPYSRMHSIEIGDSWRVREASNAPAARPTWFVRDLGWFLLVLVVLGGLAVALRVG